MVLGGSSYQFYVRLLMIYPPLLLMFCLCFPAPSFLPTLPPHHRATQSSLYCTLYFTLLSPHPRSQLYTRENSSLFIFHSRSSSLPSPTGSNAWWERGKETPLPKSLFTKVVLEQTSRQRSRGVELHPRPFMIEQSAKGLTTAQKSLPHHLQLQLEQGFTKPSPVGFPSSSSH